MINSKQKFSDRQDKFVGDVCMQTEVNAINHDLGVDPVEEMQAVTVVNTCTC